MKSKLKSLNSFKYIMLLMVIVILSGCTKNYPTYYSYNDNDYTFVMINNIEYTRGPWNWRIDSKQIGDIIGYLDDSSRIIYSVKGDTNSNYFYVKFGNGYDAYFKKDYIYPDVSADTVNMIEIWQASDNSKRDVTNKEIIRELFEELKNGTSIKDVGDYKPYCYIYCYFEHDPGIRFSYLVEEYDNKFVCGIFPSDKFVEIPKKLVFQLNGQKVN